MQNGGATRLMVASGNTIEFVRLTLPLHLALITFITRISAHGR
jgi:hypothetical protein